MGVVFVRVHEPEQVRGILDDAFAMATELTNDEREWCHIFDKAVDLLGNRLPLVNQPTSINLPSLGLDGR